MRNVKLTEEQANFLEDLILHDMDDEYLYQLREDPNDIDESTFEMLLEILEAVYKPPGLCFGEPALILEKKKDLEELKKWKK